MTCGEKRGHCRLIHQGSAPDVNQIRTPLHHGQGPRTDHVIGVAVEMGQRQQKIALRNHGFEIGALRNNPRRQIHGLWIGIQHLHAEGRQPDGNGPAHGPHADDARRTAGHPCSIQLRTPAAEFAAAHMNVAFQHTACDAQQQRNRQLGGRHGQQIRHQREPHAAAGTGVDIKIIRPLQRGGDNPQPRTFGKKRFIHRIRHESHHRVAALRLDQHLLTAPCRKRLIRYHFAMLLQEIDDGFVNPVRDQHARFFGGHVNTL